MKKKETYEQFVDKFKTKKTTDDCYTPPEVYNAVLEYVNTNIMPLKDRNVIRPFYPGGDYQNQAYTTADVVVDNPPFSILAQIVDFYIENSVPFFIFAPHLTLFTYITRPTVTIIVTNALWFDVEKRYKTTRL